MAKRFYAAWTAAVLLALTVPIAVPYFIWPTAALSGARSSADCHAIARDYAAESRAASLWPLSVDVERCSGRGLSFPEFDFQARVEARGPFGIPFASSMVTSNGATSLKSNGGLVLGLGALLSVAIALSAPFAFMMLREAIGRRLVATT